MLSFRVSIKRKIFANHEVKKNHSRVERSLTNGPGSRVAGCMSWVRVESHGWEK